jgi:hypothetical protein
MSLDALFTPAQLATLRSAINCLIPADDYPGGWEAGVGVYLARQFQRDLRDQVTPYRDGLAAIDAEAQAASGCAFAHLSSADQIALLQRVERGEVHTPWALAPAPFFAMLLRQAMEGFYGDPDNGGNTNSVAWRMIGFEVRG